MGDAAMQREERYTYEEYAQWPEDERWELIDGEAFLMGAPTTQHQDLIGGMYASLRAQLKGKPCKPWLSPLDVMPKVAPGQDFRRTDTVVQPDVLVVCNPAQIEMKGILGAPTFVIEVLSPSTAFRDQTKKLKLYEACGVAEYWLVLPDTKTLTVYRRQTEGGYGVPQVYIHPGPVPLTSLPGVNLDPFEEG